MKFFKFENLKFQTPIVRYERRNDKITFIGVMHIGEEQYYSKLQEIIDSIPNGFYEMIKTPTKTDIVTSQLMKIKKAARETQNNLYIKNYGLKNQKEMLTYGNWANADATLDDIIYKLGPMNPVKELIRIKTFELMLKIFSKILKENFMGNPSVLKNIGEKMGENRTTPSKKDSILLDYRNGLLFEALNPILMNELETEFGIIYGANHLPGINDFLQQQSFKAEELTWLTAIDLSAKLSPGQI